MTPSRVVAAIRAALVAIVFIVTAATPDSGVLAAPNGWQYGPNAPPQCNNPDAPPDCPTRWQLYPVPTQAIPEVVKESRGRCSAYNATTVICQNGPPPSGNGGPSGTFNNSPSFQIANGKYWVRWRPGDPHYGGNLTEDRYINPNDKSKGPRWVIVQNTNGFIELTVPQINKQGGVVNVTYRLRQSDVISEGANYYLVQFKQENSSKWQPMKPIRLVQVLRNTNVDGYTVYIGSPNLPSTPTEYWVP
jgi:hypothetical protein